MHHRKSSILVFDYQRLLVCSWVYLRRGSQNLSSDFKFVCYGSGKHVKLVRWQEAASVYSAICSMYAVTDFQVLLMKVQIGQSCAYKPFSAIGHGKAIDHVLRRR